MFCRTVWCMQFVVNCQISKRDARAVFPDVNWKCAKIFRSKITVKCFPMPDALNPCEDVMGSQWLRSSVWIVVLLAVFGNIAVLVVLFSNWSRMHTNRYSCGQYCSKGYAISFDPFNRNDVTVPKFLMSHLAFADLCLGLYLLLIATIDLHSMGEYFNFAYDWQYGKVMFMCLLPFQILCSFNKGMINILLCDKKKCTGSGCKVAGFLTVFASHLSVFTLTIITIERWFAITNAINLNKRIKLKAASIIMACGWIYAIFMSSLPLFGVSNYSSTRYTHFRYVRVCLRFPTNLIKWFEIISIIYCTKTIQLVNCTFTIHKLIYNIRNWLHMSFLLYSICLPMEARDSLDVAYLVLIIGLNGFAFFIIAICYSQIYFSLGKETRQAARYASRGEMTVAKKMALLVRNNTVQHADYKIERHRFRCSPILHAGHRLLSLA